MLEKCLLGALKFKDEAHKILSKHEQSASRLIFLEDSYKTLSNLNMQQDELFRQSLRCIENSLFRASHVMAWSGFMDFLEEKIYSDKFAKLKLAYPKWICSSIEELRENNTEYQIIESTKKIGLCSRNEVKALHGLLHKRNECAHPSTYFPQLNETLGYISELFNRIKSLSKRSL